MKENNLGAAVDIEFAIADIGIRSLFLFFAYHSKGYLFISNFPFTCARVVIRQPACYQTLPLIQISAVEVNEPSRACVLVRKWIHGRTRVTQT